MGDKLDAVAPDPPPVGKRLSREELQKRKEMEQDRKAGIGPLIVSEDGRGFTSQVPHFITKTPWYVTHQSEPQKKTDYTQQPKSSIHQVTRQRTAVQSGKKYREGACENCGSLTHRTKECLERPRKVSVKYSVPTDAVLDEEINEPEMNFDSKRDRWRDYDPKDYQQVIEDWREPEAEERDDKQAEENCPIPGQKVDLSSSATRMTVRNLRMREDVAKYLHNLEDTSSNYDPKTRAMRSGPNANNFKTKSDDYLGSNFVKPAEVSTEMRDLRLFAWECHKVGETDIHMQANPTLTEQKFKEQAQQKESKKKTLKQSLLEKYGEQEV